MRPLQEAFEQPELVEDLHRRGMDGVAAEIAEEVGVLFEDADLAAGAGEQQAGHHSRGPAADDEYTSVIAKSQKSHPMRRLALPACQRGNDVMGSAGRRNPRKPVAPNRRMTNAQRRHGRMATEVSTGFSDALTILGAAGIVIPAFARIRISPVIGFILVGMIVGPFALGA